MRFLCGGRESSFAEFSLLEAQQRKAQLVGPPPLGVRSNCPSDYLLRAPSAQPGPLSASASPVGCASDVATAAAGAARALSFPRALACPHPVSEKTATEATIAHPNFI